MKLDETPGETNSELIRLLCVTAYAAYSSNLAGGVPAAHARSEWFRNPQPEDLVLEMSSVARGDWRLRIGHLVRTGYEPFHADDEWEVIKGDYEGEKRPVEKVWYIRLLYNRQEVRWTNADFIRVPSSDRQFWDITIPTRLAV